MRALIDTCIVIDVLQSREPFCLEAQEAAIFLFVVRGLYWSWRDEI
mgnify:CR=1 FL=1